MTHEFLWRKYVFQPDGPNLEDLAAAIQAMLRTLKNEEIGPRSSLSPSDLHSLIRSIEICPEDGQPLLVVLSDLSERVWAHCVSPAHPAYVAHLHPPPLIPAIVTEVAIAATNQSMDSWDQAPAGTELELHLVEWLGAELGLPGSSSGVMTSGGTASNLLGLALARSWFGAKGGHDPFVDGMPPEARMWRIVASDQSHFSIERAAAQLGLGSSSVISVATDETGKMDLTALDSSLMDLSNRGFVPIAIVATAGTTDLGAVDPIEAIADRAEKAGSWLHVDAAVGGAFVLSDKLRPLLAGIDRAHSVTVDFHKLWWQPLTASALVVRDAAEFGRLRVPSAYLDRGDEPAGIVNLVGRSLDTSRRFDAAKVVASLRTVGRKAMGAMVEHLVDLAHCAANEIAESPSLRLVAPVNSVTCVFDQVGASPEVLRVAQQRLFDRGEAAIGRTVVKGRPALKLTFVNPLATKNDVRAIVRDIERELNATAIPTDGTRSAVFPGGGAS
jgi:L-2,4-diaminobutyrate decarboxylase